MTASHFSFSNLSDDQLLAEVKRLVAHERSATAALIRSLMELDARRLYLGEGCSSLFTYCTQILRLAEGSAYNRIEAARAARRFPIILDVLDDGSVTLTAVRLLAPHLTHDNHRDVLASARHKTKREVELLIAALSPKPDTRSVVRKLAMPSVVAIPLPAGTPCPEPIAAVEHRPEASAADITESPRRAHLAPLTPERYKVQLTISRETHDRLRRIQDLLRHVIPNGDPAEIFDRALTVLLADLERRRYAATPNPRAGRNQAVQSRHIPAAVKREVWKRDEGRCAFVGAKGRCNETGFLEFHHVEPFAAGGGAAATNIELRCRAHNQFEASLYFGTAAPELVRESAPPWPTCGGPVASRS
jgi:hypothetical protein